MQYRWITVCNTVLLVLSTTLLTAALFRNSWWKNEHVHVGLHGVCVNKDYTTSAERCVNFDALGTFADTLPGYIQFSDTELKDIACIRVSVMIGVITCMFSVLLSLLSCFSCRKRDQKVGVEKSYFQHFVHILILISSVLRAISTVWAVIKSVNITKSDETSLRFGASFALLSMVILTSVVVTTLTTVMIIFTYAKKSDIKDAQVQSRKIEVVVELTKNDQQITTA